MALPLDQFEMRIAASGLVSADELRDFVAGLDENQQPPDSQALARLLVKHKKLTAYQAQEIYKGGGQKLVLGNYVILDKLGQGGMGMVLKAEHKRMKRIVAVKVLSPALVKSEEAVKRFHREVEAAARLEHPNIVAAHDADEANGTHFLVMQFVDGSDLSSLVRRSGPLPVAKAVDCILQAARGLEYAHGEGVIHRDIKPANLLLDGKGTVKILDMGLARFEDSAVGGAADLTGTGQIMGTVDYMAPEQAVNTKHADQRADIYALGISLWYLITGKVAYDGETLMEKIMAHQSGPIPSLCEVSASVSPELDAVFRRMVAKSPAERYQTMSEVIAALERCRTAKDGSSLSVTLRPNEDRQFSDFLRGASATGDAISPRAPAVVQDALTELPDATLSIFDQAEATSIKPEIDVRVSPASVPVLSGMPRHGESLARKPAKVRTASLVLVGGLAAAAVVIVGLPLGIWLSTRGEKAKDTAAIDVPEGGSVESVHEDDSGDLPPGPPVTPAGTYALEFDGVDDYVDFPILLGSGVRTIEAIATPARGGGPAVQICGREWLSITTRGEAWGAMLQGKDRRIVRWGDQSLCAGRTDHVAVVAEARSLRLYVNGQSSGSIQSVEVKRTGRANSTIGVGPAIGGQRRYFAGKIHAVRVSTSARYAGPFTAPARLTKDADTIALYQFDEGQGTELKDSSGNNYHGKIVGARWVKVGSSQEALPATAPGSPRETKPPVGSPPETLAPTFRNTLGMEFALVPKGQAWQGGGGGRPGSKPVEFKQDFYVGVHEVTRTEWQKVTGKAPRVSGGGQNEDPNKFPVNNVTWFECREFMKQLNEQTNEPGWKYRLPTQVEWEYACRGGPMATKDESSFDYYFDKPSNTITTANANFGDRLKRPCDVGKYPPNKLGLYDMFGNVAEWCDDEGGFRDAGGKDARVNRGGSWWENAGYCKITWQSRWAPSPGQSHIGFRVARVPTSETSASSPPSAKSPDNAAASSANVVYLDDLQEEPPKGKFLGRHGMGTDGRPCLWLGAKPAHSLFTHPGNNSSFTVTYPLDGKYNEFLATIGVLAKPISKLTFRVWGDDKKLWESTPISAPQQGTDLRVSVRGVKELKLEVHCPGSFAYAHAIWIDPRLTGPQ